MGICVLFIASFKIGFIKNVAVVQGIFGEIEKFQKKGNFYLSIYLFEI